MEEPPWEKRSVDDVRQPQVTSEWGRLQFSQGRASRKSLKVTSGKLICDLSSFLEQGEYLREGESYKKLQKANSVNSLFQGPSSRANFKLQSISEALIQGFQCVSECMWRCTWVWEGGCVWGCVTTVCVEMCVRVREDVSVFLWVCETVGVGKCVRM